MAKRTFSRRNTARSLTEKLRREKERENRVRKELIKYLKGEDVSINRLIKDIASTEEPIVVKYDESIIRIDKDGFLIASNSSWLEDKLNYLMFNLPPTPKSFELFYENYMKLESEKDKKKFAEDYFKTLPKYVRYYIPINNGFAISFVKKDNGINYKKSRGTFLGKKYNLSIVYEILKYVNAHSH